MNPIPIRELRVMSMLSALAALYNSTQELKWYHSGNCPPLETRIYNLAEAAFACLLSASIQIALCQMRKT